jgi:hypothetical protein
MHEFDKSSKWLIQHHGDSILRLAGVHDIAAWTPLQTEPVQPRRLPDGLLEVRRQSRARPSLFVLEISTYPYTRLAKQAADDALLVYLERRAVPGVVALILHPRGNRRAPGEITLQSVDGSTRIDVAWKVVELWTIPAEQLLAAGDVGLIPWVPLAQFDGPPERLFRECRTRIDRDAPLEERENLRVVTHFLAGLKYNDARLFQLLGGREAMVKIGSPILREIIDESTRETVVEDVTTVLVARFGSEAEALEPQLKAIDDAARLKELLRHAAKCRTLGSFRKQLAL